MRARRLTRWLALPLALALGLAVAVACGGASEDRPPAQAQPASSAPAEARPAVYWVHATH